MVKTGCAGDKMITACSRLSRTSCRYKIHTKGQTASRSPRCHDQFTSTLQYFPPTWWHMKQASGYIRQPAFDLDTQANGKPPINSHVVSSKKLTSQKQVLQKSHQIPGINGTRKRVPPLASLHPAATANSRQHHHQQQQQHQPKALADAQSSPFITSHENLPARPQPQSATNTQKAPDPPPPSKK